MTFLLFHPYLLGFLLGFVLVIFISIYTLKGAKQTKVFKPNYDTCKNLDKICVRIWKQNGETRLILEYKLPVLLYIWIIKCFPNYFFKLLNQKTMSLFAFSRISGTKRKEFFLALAFLDFFLYCFSVSFISRLAWGRRPTVIWKRSVTVFGVLRICSY